MTQREFIQSMVAEVEAITQYVKTLQELSPQALNYKPSPESWSLLECLAHLNRYAQYYLPHFEQVRAPHSKADPIRRSFFGSYFIGMMKRPAKMKTFTRMNPAGSKLSVGHTFSEFFKHQEALIGVINDATALNDRSIPVEFFKLLKLRKAEAIEFVVVHQQRHLLQMKRLIPRLPEKSATLAV